MPRSSPTIFMSFKVGKRNIQAQLVQRKPDLSSFTPTCPSCQSTKRVTKPLLTITQFGFAENEKWVCYCCRDCSTPYVWHTLEAHNDEVEF